MTKEEKKIYPDHDTEEWTSITPKALEKAGFEIYQRDILDNIWYHPKWPQCFLSKVHGEWNIFYEKAYQETFDEPVRLREIKYMYQVDNMFHGFTDRWLGLI
jgi:hypothetical protein